MRGGMCKRPFAGNPSMNELDDEFMAALFKGEATVDQTISLRIIKMSVRDYLYFGLGSNHITPERFLEAYAYLYKVRALAPCTWGDHSVAERYRNLDGVIETRRGKILPEEIRAKCFDTHYDLSQLSRLIPISDFLRRLKEKRKGILNANIKQVLTYMDAYRCKEWRSLTRRKGKYSFPRVRVVHTLTAPISSKELAQLYLYGRDPASPKTLLRREKPNSLRYKSLLF
jgi:hypothetical protein